MMENTGWNKLKYFLAAIICGWVASIALPPFGFSIGLLALSFPLWYLSKTTKAREAFFLGWAMGFGWFVHSLYWISNSLIVTGGWHLFLIPIVVIGFPLFFAIYWGIAFVLTHIVARKLQLKPDQIIMIAVITLALMEFFRGLLFTGFPWNTIGMVSLPEDIHLGIVPYIGLVGMSALLLGMSAIPALIFVRARRSVMILAGIGVIAVGLSFFQPQSAVYQSVATGMTIRLVQPNVDQKEKWQPGKRQNHLNHLVALSNSEPEQNLDAIIWPETAFAGAYGRETKILTNTVIAAMADRAPLITGAFNIEDNPFAIYNSALLFDVDGSVKGIANKARLVPFGEYIPFRDFIPYVEAIATPNDISAGVFGQEMLLKRQNAEEVKILPLICYEIIFPTKLRDAVIANNSDIIVNITNDAWFGDSIGPRQHLAFAQIRAAELGIPVLRVAGTGITAHIDSNGRVIQQIDYGTEGFIDITVGNSALTFFRRYGDIGFDILIILYIFMASWSCCLTRKSEDIYSPKK